MLTLWAGSNLGGLGHHFSTLDTTQQEYYEKGSLAAQILYALTLGSAKLSMIWMLQRIFGVSENFHWIAYGLMAVSLAWILQTILIALFLCHPVSMTWDSSVTGSCGNSVSVAIYRPVSPGPDLWATLSVHVQETDRLHVMADRRLQLGQRRGPCHRFLRSHFAY